MYIIFSVFMFLLKEVNGFGNIIYCAKRCPLLLWAANTKLYVVLGNSSYYADSMFEKIVKQTLETVSKTKGTKDLSFGKSLCFPYEFSC